MKARKKFTAKFLVEHIAKEDITETQLLMESYIRYMKDPELIREFILALISQKYELSENIPNTSGLFYRMFQTPLTRPKNSTGLL